MSTPDQPDTPPLTRRRLREIRHTGATPVVPPADNDTSGGQDVAEVAPPIEAPPVVAPSAPLARAAEPAPLAPAPIGDAHVDLGAMALTRRQAREQERIRTASVPVITPDIDVRAGSSSVARPADGGGAPSAPAATDVGRASLEVKEPAEAPDRTAEGETDQAEGHPAPTSGVEVNPGLGSELLAGEVPSVTLPPSFDSLIARNASTGSVSTPNALILSQTPTGAPLVAPVTATGEVIITGSFDLPEGLGSVGHAPGATDGRDLDAALIDGELPPASSPTPIAASAAISTVRSSDDIIRPPAPEKGSKLMVTLAITAGVLALALVGVLILTIATGTFS